MIIFFDTEFTGLVPNTTLISIGMVTEHGDQFYAEFMDYDKELVTSWIQENVIEKLYYSNYPDIDSILNDEAKKSGHEILMMPMPKGHSRTRDGGLSEPLDFGCYGTTKEIKNKILRWFRMVNPDNEHIQLIGDVCHYDMYLFCNQIFDGAFSLPENVNPVCYDICQEIDLNGPEYLALTNGKTRSIGRRYLENWFEGRSSLIDLRKAFDISREDICKAFHKGKLPEGEKHNALYDAKIIKMIFEAFYEL